MSDFLERFRAGEWQGQPITAVMAALAALPISEGLRQRLGEFMKQGMSPEEAIASLGTMGRGTPPGEPARYNVRVPPYAPPATVAAPTAAPTPFGWRLQRLMGTQGLMGRRA